MDQPDATLLRDRYNIIVMAEKTCGLLEWGDKVFSSDYCAARQKKADMLANAVPIENESHLIHLQDMRSSYKAYSGEIDESVSHNAASLRIMGLSVLALFNHNTMASAVKDDWLEIGDGVLIPVDLKEMIGYFELVAIDYAEFILPRTITVQEFVHMMRNFTTVLFSVIATPPEDSGFKEIPDQGFFAESMALVWRGILLKFKDRMETQPTDPGMIFPEYKSIVAGTDIDESETADPTRTELSGGTLDETDEEMMDVAQEQSDAATARDLAVMYGMHSEGGNGDDEAEGQQTDDTMAERTESETEQST